MFTIRMILRGCTTFESLTLGGKKRSGLVCIPTQSASVTRLGDGGPTSHDRLAVFAPEAKEGLYDLGWRANFEKFRQQPLFPNPTPLVPSLVQIRLNLNNP
jgi:hypothetical protein